MWPANSNYLNEAVSHMATVLAMSSSHIGFVQYPVIKSQTNQTTLVKHRHALDLLLLKAGLTAYHMVQIAYDKPDSSARDTRCLSQLAMVVFHANFDACDFMERRAVKEGRFGPVPLIRVADMIGFDEARRPAPSARTEQMLDLSFFSGGDRFSEEFSIIISFVQLHQGSSWHSCEQTIFTEKFPAWLSHPPSMGRLFEIEISLVAAVRWMFIFVHLGFCDQHKAKERTAVP